MKRCFLPLFVLLIKVCHGIAEEVAPCEPGFSEQRYAFPVTRKVLERGRFLGKVSFNTCSPGRLALYSAGDTRFRVFPDGRVTVKRQVTLHDGSVSFVLNGWDAAGKNYSATVFVWNEKEQPKTSHVLKRQKRDRVIPPIGISENERGPYPKRIVQFSSTKQTQNKNIRFSLSGEGVDLDPVGVFSIDAKTGFLMVNKALDRESKDKYQMLVHVQTETGEKVEEPFPITVRVTDQNDNRPFFTQTTFDGFVTEGAPKGTSVMTISAKDLDDTRESTNGVLRYSIQSQSPKEPSNAFAIAADTGVITVNAEGLTHQRNPKFTLSVKVADMEGHGHAITAAVQITVGKDVSLDMSGSSPSLLTTHVLDTAQGMPAKGLTVTSSRFNAREAKWEHLSRGVTDEDGRCSELLGGGPLTAGTYQLRFESGEYWKRLKLETFYPYATVVFDITNPKQKHHVPLLITPHSYSTYRGS